MHFSKSIHSSLLSWRDSYLKNWNIKSKMIKAEVLMKKRITYTKHIKIQHFHMDFIFMLPHLIWKGIQCVHILSLIMHFDTENVYCGVVLTVHVSIFLKNKQIKNMKKQYLQLGFTFITSLHVVLLMVEFHWKTKNIYYMCKQESSPDKSTKIYTRKELVMMETKKSDFHTSFYILAIQKLAFTYHMCS